MVTNPYFQNSTEAAAQAAEFIKRISNMPDEELFAEYAAAKAELGELALLKSIATEAEIVQRHGYDKKPYRQWLEAQAQKNQGGK
ncbi:hypothetical protein DB459_03495 [Bradyrhizobium sp. WD16]|nr:hypothetical protein DB459_03495 [Bradyrhizobium sp. WD16]